jgi:hypothetical protein
MVGRMLASYGALPRWTLVESMSMERATMVSVAKIVRSSVSLNYLRSLLEVLEDRERTLALEDKEWCLAPARERLHHNFFVSFIITLATHCIHT